MIYEGSHNPTIIKSNLCYKQHDSCYDFAKKEIKQIYDWRVIVSQLAQTKNCLQFVLYPSSIGSSEGEAGVGSFGGTGTSL